MAVVSNNSRGEEVKPKGTRKGGGETKQDAKDNG